MFKIYYLLLLAILVLPVTAFSQINPRGMDEEMEEQEPEAKKPEVESVIKTWMLQGEGTFIHFVKRDTTQDKFQIYNPIYKNAITNTYTGNYGGPYLNDNFFSRNYNTDFLFLQTHDAYLLTPKNVQYYNTTTPYTLLEYSQSENKSKKNETRFNVLHTQNITPDLNITFRFDQARSQGQYIEQENKNNFITLYSSYVSDKVNIHGGFISNRVGNGENGGMKDDNQIFGAFDFIQFNLVDTRSQYNSNYFYFNSEYKMGAYVDTSSIDLDGIDMPFDSVIFRPRYSFNNYLEYSTNLRQFTEAEDGVNNDYFPPALISDTITNDSARFHKFTSIFQVKQFENSDKKYSFGKRAYLGFDFVKVGFSGPAGPGYFTDKYSDVYVGGGIFRETGKFWKWNFQGRFYLTGYHSGQTNISGTIYKPFVLLKDSAASIEITGKIENRVPDYFIHQYNSNHYSWYNSFNHEQRMTAGVKLSSEKRKLEVGANYALINNFIYYDTIGVPAQTKKELLILSAFLNKRFEFGHFFVDTKLLAQKSSSEEFIHLPEFSAYLGVYYKLLISKVMYAQLGFDARYNTKYYADAFNPATGFFYLQNEKEIGNYPYIDAYASLKLKRTRVFFKLINVGTSFLKEEYFTALHYPMNRMTFRLGVDWKFYD